MKHLRLFFAAAMLLPVFCAAQDQGGGEDGGSDIKLAKEDDDHPCAPDMHKFCESLYNGDRMKQWNCLQEHGAELSSPCKKELGLIVEAETQKATRKQKRKPQTAILGTHPCVDDRDEFCSDVKGDQEKETKCLLTHPREISDECRNRLRKDAKKTKKKVVKPAPAEKGQ